MLERIDIGKSYPIHHGRSRRQVLHHVDLTVRPGGKWGITGRNGAGRSTRIRILSGSDRPHRGAVRLDPGRLTVYESVDAAIRAYENL